MSNAYHPYAKGDGGRMGSRTPPLHRDRERERGSSRDARDYPARQAPPSKMFDGPQQSPAVPFVDSHPPGEGAPNDCEIIAIGGPDDAYVNMVENGIKDIGLKVDVMIPKPTVKISVFIENLALKGTIFAVVVRPDNAQHRSVSVHVLRGPPKPEEHRNMPLPTAFSLIAKSYSDLKKKEVGMVPDAIKTVFRYILEDKQLTDNEYAVVIAFLQERRKRQASFESRTPYDGDKGYYSTEELQQRILAMIGGGSKPSGPDPAEILSRPMDHNPVNPLSRGGFGGHGGY